MDNKYYLDQNGLKALINKSVGLGNYFIAVILDQVTWDKGDSTIIDQSGFTAGGQTTVQFMRFNNTTSVVDVSEYGEGYVRPKIGLSQSVFVNCFNRILAITNTTIENENHSHSEIFKLCDINSEASKGNGIGRYVYRNEDNSKEFILTATTTAAGQQSLTIAYKDVLNNYERNVIYVDAYIDTTTPSEGGEIAAGTLQIDTISLVHVGSEGNISDITDQWSTILNTEENLFRTEVELRIPADDYMALVSDSPNIIESESGSSITILRPSIYDIQEGRSGYMMWVSDPASTLPGPQWIFKLLNSPQIGPSASGLIIERIQPITPSDIVAELNYSGPYTVTLKNTGNYSPTTLIQAFQINGVDVTSPSLDTPVTIQRGDKIYVEFKIPKASGGWKYTTDLQVEQDSPYEKYTRNTGVTAISVTIPCVKGNSTIDIGLSRAKDIG